MMEKRVDNLEKEVSAMRNDVSDIRSRLSNIGDQVPHLATKLDVSSSTNKLIIVMLVIAVLYITVLKIW